MPYRFFKNSEPLNLPELTLLNHFQLYYQKMVNRHRAIPIFRGESLDAVYHKLGVDPQYGGLKQLSQRLFLFGDKARHYFSSDHFDKLGKTFAIDDCSPRVLSYVYDQIHRTIKEKHPAHNAFYEKNPSFRDYFLQKANKRDFTLRLEKLSIQKRLTARNYYLRLIHQFSTPEYRTQSHGLSTSKSYKTASTFAKGLVLHAWDPALAQNYTLRKDGLPMYAGMPYAEAEVTLMGGLLPHYIIGVELTKEKVFLVNPWLFNATVNEKLFIEGLPVDQRNFDNELRLTRYGGGYIVDDGMMMDL
jgi:hypothetical protein